MFAFYRRLVRRVIVVLALAAALGSPSADAGFPPPTPGGDWFPVWSPDGSAIAFTSTRGHIGLHVVARDGSGERRLPLPFVVGGWFAFSPDWSWLAFASFESRPGANLVVARPEASEMRSLGEVWAGETPSWSPDGARVAFVRSDSGSRSVYVVGIDGTGLVRVAPDATAPSWSPGGARIAFLQLEGNRPTGIAVAEPLAIRTLASGLDIRSARELAWSRDGTRLATVSYDAATKSWALEVVPIDDSERLSVKLPSPVNDAWSPGSVVRVAWRGSESIAVSAGQIYEFVLSTGRFRLISAFGQEASYSPDGRELLFSGNGECRDRSGIYRAPAEGGEAVRLTNDCRIRGTAGRDVLRGTEWFDLIQGLGADDELTVDDRYAGDDVEGGDGDDTIRGGNGRNHLDGGRGADRIDGGSGSDTLTGGAGRDMLFAGGGPDTIHAADGAPDRISCGTNLSPTSNGGFELDVAYVDAGDQVAKDCELVRDRTGAVVRATASANLTIRVWPRGSRGRSWRTALRCEPPGGTLPRAAAACRRIASRLDPFAPVRDDRGCRKVYGGPQLAQVSGRFRGGRVVSKFNRLTACEIARWDRLAFLFVRRN